MAEYISREELIKALETDYNRSWCSKPQGVEEYVEGARDEYDDVLKIISGMKSADVQPVKRGKWIETHISLCKWVPEDEKEEGHSFYMAELKCSCCKRYNAVTFVLTLDKPDFCQLCGARMDGDSK